MSIFLLAAVLFAPPAAANPNRIFACSFGTKQLEVIGRGDTLTYRFGRPGKPEITLTGGPSGGVSYHRSMYTRGEDQTLRFTSGAHVYVVFNRWVAPYELSTGERPPKINKSGLLIFKDGEQISRLNCLKGGDLREWPVFKKLKQDEGNLVPDDIG